MARKPARKRKKSTGVRLAPRTSPSLEFRLRRIQLAAVLVSWVVLTVAVTEMRAPRSEAGAYDIESEVVAPKTISAAFAFDAVDLEATRRKQDEQAALVPSTHSVETERVQQALQLLQQRINVLQGRDREVDDAVRNALLASSSAQAREQVVIDAVTELARGWADDPVFDGFPGPEFIRVWILPSLESVPRREFGTEQATTGAEDAAPAAVVSLTDPEVPFQYALLESLGRLATNGLEYVLTKGVRSQGSVSATEAAKPGTRIVVLREATVGDLRVSEEMPLGEVETTASVRGRLRTTINERGQERLPQTGYTSVGPEQIVQAAFEMAQTGIVSTLEYNQVVTEGNRELARSQVEPVMKRIEMNQSIQREGERWTAQTRSDALRYWEMSRPADQGLRGLATPLVANGVLVTLLLLGFLHSVPVIVRKKTHAFKTVLLVLLVTCGTLIVGRVMSYFEFTGLGVPLTASAILLTVLTNARVAAVASLVMAMLLSVQYNMDWRLLIVATAMAYTGIANLYTVRRRSNVASAAMRATIVGLVTIAAIRLAHDRLIEHATLQMLVAVGLNGVACMFIAPGLLSPLERLFKITTDLQLLEYSDLNNELLRRLALEVPATYAHSLMMGQLAEAAADAIGANGLLARVSAYYHDIGKLRRPEYFVENQAGYNIHEDLSPRLSARAIAKHVQDGVDLAQDHHLPQPMIDGIREHHGTMLISFFYQQAMEQQKHGDVREEDFRYPGPKPQSRETAILMICDGVESGVRSIKNPNEERVREFIEKIIQIRLEDRQFDDCDITLRQLDLISDALAARYLSTVHTRIAYPEKPEKTDKEKPEEAVSNVIRMTTTSE